MIVVKFCYIKSIYKTQIYEIVAFVDILYINAFNCGMYRQCY